MSILNVEHLTHGFGDRAIFHDVSFRLLKGEHIGLVGANGEGKSTFFNIVTDKLMPDEGRIQWAKNVRVGYLDQHSVLAPGMTIRDVLKSAFSWLFELEERMNTICDSLGEASPEEMEVLMEELGTIQDTLTMHDFYVIDSKVEEVARALGLLDLGLDRDVTDLSGGQRTKVLLAKLLLEKPDILLLDEPTNYLDEEHIAWLKRYLQEYENAFILISHDIPFLNDVINIVYHMENQELNRYVGDYDHFQEVYEVKKAQLEAAYRRQQQEISELKDFVARNKARVSTRNMAMSRQKKLDKMDVIELAAEKPKPEFHFKQGRTPGKYIFETKDLVIGYNEPLSRPLTLSMERGQKIALVGANGIGKTTLLKSILGLIPSLKGTRELGDNLQIGYFEQEVKGDNKTTCIDEIWAEFPSYTQYEVRSALAKCGLTTKHIESQVRVLSGGEQAKVRLCKLVNKETNVLLLDEPTNHLDVDAKEALKEALKEYRGSVNRLEFEEAVLQSLDGMETLKADQYVRNSEGELLSTAEDGTRYIVKEWFADRECDLKDEREVLSAVRALALLHRQFRMIKRQETWNMRSMISLPLFEAMRRHNRELKKARTFIRGKRKKNEFELRVIGNFEIFAAQAVEAERGMEKLYEIHGKEIADGYAVCHGEPDYHHILIGNGYTAVTEFNQMHLGVQMEDLYYFLRKIMEKHDWNERLGRQVMESYERVLPVSEVERQVLYYLFLYPEKYWKQINFYYNANKAWVPAKSTEKIRKLEAQQEARESFIQTVIQGV